MKPTSLSNDEKEEVARINILRAANSTDTNTEFKTYTP